MQGSDRMEFFKRSCLRHERALVSSTSPAKVLTSTEPYLQLLPLDLASQIAEFLPFVRVASVAELTDLLATGFPYERVKLVLEGKASLERSLTVDEAESDDDDALLCFLRNTPRNLKEIVLDLNGLVPLEVVEAVAMNATLAAYYLYTTRLNAVEMDKLSALLCGYRGAKELHVLDCKTDGFQSVMALAQSNPKLSALELSSSSKKDVLSLDCCKVLANVLQQSQCMKQLHLHGVSLSKRAVHAICEALNSSRSLEDLHLHDNKISEEEGACFGNALRSNTCLKRLGVSHNDFGTPGARALGMALTENTTLEELYLYHNSIESEGMQALSAALRVNTGLVKLDLSFSYYSDTMLLRSNNALSEERYAGARMLGHALKINMSLQVLYLDDSGIGDQDAQVLSEALRSNSVLKLLYLEMNKIGNAGAESLSKALMVNQGLEVLKLDKNFICAKGGIALASSLRYNTTLKCLSLYYNGIGTHGLQAFGEALALNNSLEDLCLCDTFSGRRNQAARTQALKTLSTGLQANQGLKKLNLGRNMIGDEDLSLLCVAIGRSQSLTSLSLHGNLITANGCRVLCNELARESVLQELNLSGNSLGDTGCSALSEVLERRTAMRMLQISRNGIGDEGAKRLGKGLAGNLTLKMLDLGTNSIGHLGCKALCDGITCNIALRKLSLNCNLLDDEAAMCLAKTFEGHTYLQSLFIKGNQFSTAAAKQLCAGVRKNRCLHELHIDAETTELDTHVGRFVVRAKTRIKQ